MRRYIVSGVSTSLIVGLLLMSVFARVHPDGSADTVFEKYGPRAGRLIIHLYESESAEFDALRNGEIDMTDQPLSKTYYNEFTQAPYNETIQVVNYGPEFGVYILDLNSNNNQYLGNPPDPAYPNPVADNNESIGNPAIKGGDGAANNHNPMSSVYMRRAIAYLADRERYISDPAIGVGFGYPMYTTIPAAFEKYLLDVYEDPAMPWAWEYTPAAANATFGRRPVQDQPCNRV